MLTRSFLASGLISTGFDSIPAPLSNCGMNVALRLVMNSPFRDKKAFKETLIEATYGPAQIKISIEANSLSHEARKTFAVMVWRAIKESGVLEFQWSEIRHSDYSSGIHAFYDSNPHVKTHRAIQIKAKNAHAGLKLRIRRQQMRLTQKQLAWRAGIDRTHLSHIEHGKVIPKYETWLKLQAVLYPDQLPPDFRCACHTHATIR